jgi:hypothetical protein
MDLGQPVIPTGTRWRSSQPGTATGNWSINTGREQYTLRPKSDGGGSGMSLDAIDSARWPLAGKERCPRCGAPGGLIRVQHAVSASGSYDRFFCASCCSSFEAALAPPLPAAISGRCPSAR